LTNFERDKEHATRNTIVDKTMLEETKRQETKNKKQEAKSTLQMSLKTSGYHNADLRSEFKSRCCYIFF